MLNTRQKLGQWGEELACRYLEGRGYKILERNYRNYFGEIDVIVQKKKKIIFVEVKAREGKKNSRPEEAVNIRKQKKLIKATEKYVLENKIKTEYRIDVIAIAKDRGERKIYLTHFKDAVKYF